nr:MAG TPA: hypothetical protein [Caudoviricetes sp.]
MFGNKKQAADRPGRLGICCSHLRTLYHFRPWETRRILL